MHNYVTQALWQNIQAVHTIPSHGELRSVPLLARGKMRMYGF